MGFPCVASLSNYILPYIIIKKIVSYISNEFNTLYGSSTQKNID